MSSSKLLLSLAVLTCVLLLLVTQAESRRSRSRDRPRWRHESDRVKVTSQLEEASTDAAAGGTDRGVGAEGVEAGGAVVVVGGGGGGGGRRWRRINNRRRGGLKGRRGRGRGRGSRKRWEGASELDGSTSGDESATGGADEARMTLYLSRCSRGRRGSACRAAVRRSMRRKGRTAVKTDSRRGPKRRAHKRGHRRGHRRPGAQHGRHVGRRRQRGRGRRGRGRKNPRVTLTRLGTSLNAFGWDVYGRLVESNPDNLVFSPFSVYAALGMLLMGAKGTTKHELISKLHVSSHVHSAFRMYDSVLGLTATNGSELSIANALYHQPSFVPLPRYQRKLKKFYQSQIQQFEEVNPEEAINAWVGNKTHGKIEDFLPEGSVTADTVLMLINAIYFKSDWLEPFEPLETTLKPFIVSSSQSVQVETMSKTGEFKVKEHPDLQATVLELPYTGDKFSMFILLPDQGRDLSSLESDLTADVLNHTLSAQMSSREVRLELPKFSLDTDQDMIPLLRKLGINSIFDSTCNLRRLTTSRIARVTQVKHRAVLEVDETGTTAAAVTNVAIGESAALLPPPEVKVNRPFLFVLRDREYGINLFMGRLVNPQR